MLNNEVHKELQRFTDYVIKQARTNLTKAKKNSSKSLYDSLKGNVKVSKNSFELGIEMENYGIYQDKGVSGKKVKYNTPYSYSTKMPPPTKLDKWIVRKGIAPRGKDGKFTGRTINSVGFKKSIQFLIARSIFNKGIKPSLFLTKPFEQAFKNLPDDLVEKFGLEVLDLFDYTIQTPKK